MGVERAEVIAPLFLATVFTGCGGSSDGGSVLDFSVHEVDRLTTRISVGDAEQFIEPERAFLLRSACPKIQRAAFRPEKEGTMGVLQLWGVGLEESWGIVAWPDTGPVGRAQAKVEPDGSRRYAVGCRDCILFPGMETEGVGFGCLGPGHSLRLEKGALVRASKNDSSL